MNRQEMIQALETKGRQEWDFCIIGGGATGLGVAVDAASRGFSTLLLEQYDFAKGTSSRATKLVHGGVRYLQQGNIRLVTEALHERGILRRNAPHLVKDQSFVVPNYKWWEGPYYGIGLKVYDWMAGSLGIGPSRRLSRKETLDLAPTLDADGLRGGVLYYDGQFDDARLAIHLARTAAHQGGILLNYCQVTGLLKTDSGPTSSAQADASAAVPSPLATDSSSGRITGVQFRDQWSGKTHEIYARSVINATGVFTDDILRMDDPVSTPIITPSQGVHIMLDKDFLPGETAILVPHTDDGRVLFAVPWHNKIIVGTTDTPVKEVSIEPRALPEEIDFILQQIGRYLKKVPVRKDIRSIYAGLRPLVKSNHKKTAELARDHVILVSDTGLITITGGKWTTYRRMAEDTVNTAIAKAGLPSRPCRTATLPIHGSGITPGDFNAPLHYHGSDAPAIRALAATMPGGNERLHARLPYIRAEITWAAREELCMTVEDALSRRTRSLLLDAQAAIDCAPLVAGILATELGRDQAWQEKEVEAFTRLAANYQA
jgi:glycerol-3-phosphate dehydrogenase